MNAPPRPWQRNTALAEAAAAELMSRQKHYPQMIADLEISRALANDDLAAWALIAELFDRGFAVDADLGWPDLLAATRRALEMREAACREKPMSAPLATRLAFVELIHRLMTKGQGAALEASMPIPEPAAHTA